jgi:DNA-binding transcriptional MerR regulator
MSCFKRTTGLERRDLTQGASSLHSIENAMRHAHVEPPAGYRDYRRDAAERLRFVRAAQAVGLTLGEIRQILTYRDQGETPCSHVVSVIRRRAAQIDQPQAMRREPRRLERRARTLRPDDCTPADIRHEIPGRSPRSITFRYIGALR